MMMTDEDKSKLMVSYIETKNNKDYIVSINGKSMDAYIYPIDDCIKIDLLSSRMAEKMVKILLEMTQDKKED